MPGDEEHGGLGAAAERHVPRHPGDDHGVTNWLGVVLGQQGSPLRREPEVMSEHTRYLPTAGVRPTRLWHGKYEGIVVDIQDPEKRGRVRLQVPQISGTEIS